MQECQSEDVISYEKHIFQDEQLLRDQRFYKEKVTNQPNPFESNVKFCLFF